MSSTGNEQVPERDMAAEAAEKAHGDIGTSEKVPADEETEGATNALKVPPAPPEIAKDRGRPKD